MDRDAMKDLRRWAGSKRRKPLVVNGARQVGKTWLVSEFGRQAFGAVAHVTFLNNRTMSDVFSSGLSAVALLDAVGAYSNTNPHDGRTLVFLDEIQECPAALTSLKLLCEERPDVPVVAAGSLLGVALRREGTGGASWPVGKVEYLNMHPMTFLEFLGAVGEGGYARLLRSSSLDVLAPLSPELERLLRTYLYVGGMPEAVQAYVDTRDLSEARRVQERLLLDYEHDFTKHVGSATETERIRQVWRSVPRQLAREGGTRRFAYAQVRKGGRGRDYRDPVAWVADAGLVTRVNRVSRPGVPLSAYVDEDAFKLYLLDVGLLGAAMGLDARTLLEGNRLFTEFKGVYAEQYVCQQLVASNRCVPYYWSSDRPGSRAEVDFLYGREGQVVPVEVKAEGNVRGRSVKDFAERHDIARVIRLSMLGPADQGWLLNLPLWAANLLPLDVPEDYVAE